MAAVWAAGPEPMTVKISTVLFLYACMYVHVVYVLTTLEWTIFFCTAADEDDVFCCNDDAAAADRPRERREKEEKRLKAEENTVDDLLLEQVSGVCS
jgi:hypothetical protein